MRKRVELFLRHLNVVIRRLAPWIVVLQSLSIAHIAHSAEERVVLLTEHGSEGASEAEAQLLAAARGQLAEIGVDVVSLPGAGPSLGANSRRARELAARAPTLGVVWYERGATLVVIFFYDPKESRLYTRRFAASGSAAAASEEIAVVLRSAVSAVQEGDAVAMVEVRIPEPARAEPAADPPEPPRSAAPPSPAAPPSSAEAVSSARIGYVGTLYAIGTDWQNGAALSLALQPNDAVWYVAAGYTYLPPLDLSGQGVEIELRRHVGELMAGLRVRVAPAWFLAEGAMIADQVERTTDAVPDGASPAEDSSRWQWAVSSRLGGELALGRHVHCRLTVGAEFLLSRFEQVVTSDGDGEVVASPMLARPRIEAGLVFPLW